MPCDSRIITPQQQADARSALARLERSIALGVVTVRVGRNGALAFAGWIDAERSGLTDLCAYRKLAASNSPALRRALARAEAIAGVKVNQKQIAAGTHSHDGGNTWHDGH